jgi:methionyl-tRNA formyltransferase
MLDLKITIVSTKDSWLNIYIEEFIGRLKDYQVFWVHNIEDIKEGDIAFFLGFEKIVGKEVLTRHRNNLVVHESNLPQGRGMSPMTWQILEGKNKVPITIFEMNEELDSGYIYLQDMMYFKGTELIDDIRRKQAKYTFRLCLKFLEKYPKILKEGCKQSGEITFYKSRDPNDSQLDVDKTIQQQFNLLRVVDNVRYPAYFEISGQRYSLKIELKKS